MAHVQAAEAMEAAHEQQLASHSGLLDSALDVTATVEARFGLQTNPSDALVGDFEKRKGRR